ncbi:MAG TPA: HD domain-containing phosphohydrolase [Candidatus Limnocylindrales bacterium]|nr:HD domain-containing phosphohydrolase [Candidatus Limnocylindrales bacterium]
MTDQQLSKEQLLHRMREMHRYLAGLEKTSEEQRRVEVQLRKAAEHLRTLLRNGETGLVVESSDRTVILTNEAFCDTFNLPVSPAAMVGADCSRIIDAVKQLIEEPEIFVDRINKLITERKPVSGEEIAFKDGRFFERDYRPTFTEDNSFIGHMWQYRDITDRKLAEAKLIKSKQDKETILNNMPEQVIYLDTNKIIKWANRSAVKSASPENGTLSGRYCFNALCQSSKPCLDCPIDKTIQTGQFEESEKTIYPDRTLLLSSIPVKNDAGQVTAIILTKRDITEKRQIEAKLRHRVAVKELIISLSLRFTNTPAKDLEIVISETLQELGEYATADRCCIFLFDSSLSSLSITHEWCAPGIEPHGEYLKNLPAESFSLWLADLAYHRIFHIPSVDYMPETAKNEQEILKAQSIKSLIAIPMFYRDQLIGFFSLETIGKTNNWNDDAISLFNAAGQLFTGALLRKPGQVNLRTGQPCCHTLLEDIPTLITRIDRNHHFMYVNNAFCLFVGIEYEKLIGANIYAHTPRENWIKIKKLLASLTPANAVAVHDHTHSDTQGHRRWVRWTYRAIFDIHDQLVEYLSIGEDITEQKVALEALRESEVLSRSIVSAIPDTTIRCSGDGRLLDIWANDMGTLHKPVNEQLGKMITEILPEAAAEKIVAAIKNTLLEKKLHKCEYTLSTPTGEYEFEARMVELRENEVLALIRDVTEQKITEKQLKNLSMHDPLTEIYNRAYFEEELHRLDGGREYPVTIISADIDGLKLVNDTQGHAGGDKLLLTCARVLKHPLRKNDVLARVGGDEFAIILPNTDFEMGIVIMERIKVALNHHNDQHPDVLLNVSFGLSTSMSGQSLNDVLKAADAQMYKNKLYRSVNSGSKNVSSLITALQTKDFLSQGHATRLQEICRKVAQLNNLSSRQLMDLSLLAHVHDLGNISLPDDIIFKEGPLGEQEWEDVRKHPENGYRIAQNTPDLASVAELILCHHERWDGLGYPLGLEGEKIPIESRILAIADAFDIMTHARPYSRPLSEMQALAEIKRNAGTQFDPKLVEQFLDTFICPPPAA